MDLCKIRRALTVMESRNPCNVATGDPLDHPYVRQLIENAQNQIFRDAVLRILDTDNVQIMPADERMVKRVLAFFRRFGCSPDEHRKLFQLALRRPSMLGLLLFPHNHIWEQRCFQPQRGGCRLARVQEPLSLLRDQDTLIWEELARLGIQYGASLPHLAQWAHERDPEHGLGRIVDVIPDNAVVHKGFIFDTLVRIDPTRARIALGPHITKQLREESKKLLKDIRRGCGDAWKKEGMARRVLDMLDDWGVNVCEVKIFPWNSPYFPIFSIIMQEAQIVRISMLWLGWRDPQSLLMRLPEELVDMIQSAFLQKQRRGRRRHRRYRQ